MGVTQTSLEAYWQQTPAHLNYKQRLVLEALEEICPASNKQVAEHMNWPINTVTPRMLELRVKGRVIKAYTSKDLTGRRATFWTVKGRADEYTDIA